MNSHRLSIVILILSLGTLAMLAAAIALDCRRNIVGGEFNARYNEVSCVLTGTDPFLVWSGAVPSEKYFPYNHPELKQNDSMSEIHAYTPWSYTYLMPLVFCLEKEKSWVAYRIALLLLLTFVAAIGFKYGHNIHGNRREGIFVALAALCLGPTLFSSFVIGNYGIPICASIIAMSLLLNRKHDILAGCCWALAMTKPQDALLLSIPLLFGRKWKTIFTAVIVCFLAAIPSAILCGRSPLTLILQIPKLRALGLGTNTSSVLAPLLPLLNDSPSVASWVFNLNLIFGITICATLSWMIRREHNWLVRIAPAIVCTAIWTYMTYLDRTIFSILMITLSGILLSSNDVQTRTSAALTMVLVFLAGCASFIFCFNLIIDILSKFSIAISEKTITSVVQHLDSAVILLLVCCAFRWCLASARHNS